MGGGGRGGGGRGQPINMQSTIETIILVAKYPTVVMGGEGGGLPKQQRDQRCTVSMATEQALALSWLK